MFVDEHEFTVRAGRGGDGCVSFRREKYVPKGGPDGGDGGKGGDVILVASHHLNGLTHLQRMHEVKARSGTPGSGKKCYGRNAEDVVLEVPVGTIVYELVGVEQAAAAPEEAPEEAFTERGAHGEDSDDDARESQLRILCDLAEPGVRFVVAHGGRGGWGNTHFATSTNQAPREAKPGAPGQTRRLKLEVKLIADVGLVGLPNAGKSTLLSHCTAARPKIAAYPFTTLSPYLGIVQLDRETRFVMADLPGLIEGAADGKGLGHKFLRHVERTRLLLHVIDVSSGDVEQLKLDHDVILRAIEVFSPTLAAKPRLVIASKADIPGTEAAARQLAELLGRPVPLVSGVTGAGLKELLWQIQRKLAEIRALE